MKKYQFPRRPLTESKINRCLERGLTGTKEKLFLRCFYHLAACRERTCWLRPRDLEAHGFSCWYQPLLGIPPEHRNTWKILKLIICQRRFHHVLQMTCLGEHDYFYWFRKTFHMTEIPKTKFESKGFLFSFLLSLIPLQLWYTNNKRMG